MRVTTLYAGTAAATASYYTRYLTKAPGEVPGVWQGAQAAGLGLCGEVSTEALELLLSGHHPTTGAQLGHPLNEAGMLGNANLAQLPTVNPWVSGCNRDPFERTRVVAPNRSK